LTEKEVLKRTNSQGSFLLPSPPDPADFLLSRAVKKEGSLQPPQHIYHITAKSNSQHLIALK